MKQPKERFRKFLFLLPRVLLVLLLLASTGLVVLGSFDVFEPYLRPLHATRMHQRQVLPMLTIGPYPHEQEMYRLKKDGFTGLVSLLDTRLPQEKALLRLERRIAGQLGLELVSVPVSYLPVESPENRAAADRVQQFINDHPGAKLYMHCYLGRHRVEFVRKNLAGSAEYKLSGSGT